MKREVWAVEWAWNASLKAAQQVVATRGALTRPGVVPEGWRQRAQGISAFSIPGP